MTREEAKAILIHKINNDPFIRTEYREQIHEALNMAIKALEQEPVQPKQESIDKSAMMYEIYMEGVNMSGEYQGCWVRFKNIEKIIDKYIAKSEGENNAETTRS